MSSKGKSRLPGRKMLLTVFTMAWVSIISSVGILVYLLVRSTGYYECYSYSCHKDPLARLAFELHWYHALILFVVAVIVAFYTWDRYGYYYREVMSGVIVSKDTQGGGNYPLQWTVSLRGDTRAGEKRIYTWTICAGVWHEVKVGQRFGVK